MISFTLARIRSPEMAGVPVGAPDTPALFVRDKQPLTRPDHMTTGLVGFMRVRRHSHHHARSAPQCGFSHGPRAYRVRVPIAV